MAMIIPAEKQRLIGQVAKALSAIPGLVAIALGGSHARGTHRADSDLDIGLYYRDAAPLSVDAVRDIAQAFSARGEPVVTELYGWGPWVNGGAWVETSVCKVDLLYRSLDQLEQTVREAQAGEWRHDFDQQPPFGFRSVTYLAEVACCIPLHDPVAEIAALKAAVAVYPPALRRRIVADMLWGAEFSLLFARDFAHKGDVPNTVGCMTRVFHDLVQALFALNETYFISDKDALTIIDGFERRPSRFTAAMARILGQPGSSSEQLLTSVADLTALFRASVELTEGSYQPKFVIPGL